MDCLGCGEDIRNSLEDGINGSDFYICLDCKLGFNVIISKIDEDGQIID